MGWKRGRGGSDWFGICIDIYIVWFRPIFRGKFVKGGSFEEKKKLFFWIFLDLFFFLSFFPLLCGWCWRRCGVASFEEFFLFVCLLVLFFL